VVVDLKSCVGLTHPYAGGFEQVVKTKLPSHCTVMPLSFRAFLWTGPVGTLKRRPRVPG
jgi:hypothetical protein